jgi:hypothetical protein
LANRSFSGFDSVTKLPQLVCGNYIPVTWKGWRRIPTNPISLSTGSSEHRAKLKENDVSLLSLTIYGVPRISFHRSYHPNCRWTEAEKEIEEEYMKVVTHSEDSKIYSNPTSASKNRYSLFTYIRYQNVLPNEKTRVILDKSDSDDSDVDDYINANHINKDFVSSLLTSRRAKPHLSSGIFAVKLP